MATGDILAAQLTRLASQRNWLWDGQPFTWCELPEEELWAVHVRGHDVELFYGGKLFYGVKQGDARRWAVDHGTALLIVVGAQLEYRVPVGVCEDCDAGVQTRWRRFGSDELWDNGERYLDGYDPVDGGNPELQDGWRGTWGSGEDGCDILIVERPCPTCSYPVEVECSQCAGSGWLIETEEGFVATSRRPTPTPAVGDALASPHIIRCPSCVGRQRVVKKTCEDCALDSSVPGNTVCFNCGGTRVPVLEPPTGKKRLDLGLLLCELLLKEPATPRPTKYGRGNCSGCDKSIALTKSGAVRAHPGDGVGGWCEGSKLPPADLPLRPCLAAFADELLSRGNELGAVLTLWLRELEGHASKCSACHRWRTILTVYSDDEGLARKKAKAYSWTATRITRGVDPRPWKDGGPVWNVEIHDDEGRAASCEVCAGTGLEWVVKLLSYLG
jgi:hypothetical protein